jgi:hypothetical protein
MVTKRKRQEFYGVISATTVIGETMVDAGFGRLA